MRVLIWGLGYVGIVTAACLARLGHEVIGVEPNSTKVEAVNAGRSAVKEPGLDNLVRQAVVAGRLRAVNDGRPFVSWADVSLVCVGTPSAADGSVAMDYVRNVAVDIGVGMRGSDTYHVVVLRSTVFPGATRSILGPALEEHAGRVAGRDFGLVVNPEFLREACAIGDFEGPPYTIIGQLDARSGDVVEAIFREIDAPVYRVSIEEAEILKLVNNAFHAVKIGFANEVGRLCDRLGLDSHGVMKLVCADTKLNASPAYLQPGFAFGGSCLPKDLRSLVFNARRLSVDLPILEAVLPSNRLQIEAARVKIHELGARRVAVLGLSFKPGTDDLRESPMISLIRDLWQDGVDLSVYDPEVKLDEMLGSNRQYLERQLPQIGQILRQSLEEAIGESEAVVVGQRRPEFTAALRGLDGSVAVLDLVRMADDPASMGLSKYRGINW